MSIHPSLRGANTLVGERSVLTRVERIQKLIRDGKFDPEQGSVLGLPKVRTRFKVAGAKKKKDDEEEAKPEGEAAAAAPAEDPKAAAAAPAKKGKKGK